MKPQNFTTENTETKNFSFFKTSLNSMVDSSEKEFPLKDLTGKIISCAIEVHSALGPGLLENVYEQALSHEFTLRGVEYSRQKEISLKYKGKDIGQH